jgi:hypothetical protein
LPRKKKDPHPTLSREERERATISSLLFKPPNATIHLDVIPALRRDPAYFSKQQHAG